MGLALQIRRRINFIYALIAAYFLALLFFGKKFSKFQLARPLYLHDIVLVLLVLLSISYYPRIKFYFKPIVLLLVFAFVYLIIDLVRFRQDFHMISLTIRQFGLFFYLLCSYIIFSTQVRDFSDIMKPIQLIRIIGRISVVTQVIYLIYGYTFLPRFSILGESDYSYYSPLVIMGIISYAADVITNDDRVLIKSLKFIFALLLSVTLGHSSAFLAVFIILMFYAYIKIKPYQRYISLAFIVLAVLSLFLLPQFTDFNAGWRIYYWKHIFSRSLSDGYLLLGHGFGKEYMTSDYAQYIHKTLHSAAMLNQYYPEVTYLVPPHNSWLTIVFHIGLIPALLFFLPMKNVFKQIFIKEFPADKNIMFLVLALLGSLIWIFFNVILELPHSATYFWLIYFTTVFYLQPIRMSPNSV